MTTPLIVASGFLCAWLTIGSLGASKYAALQLISGLAQLLPFADFGVGAAVISTLGKWRASGTLADLVQSTLASAQRVLFLSASGIAIAAILVWVAGFWPALLGPASGAIDNAPAIATAFTLGFAAGTALQLGSRALTGIGRNDLTMLISAATALATLCLTACAAALYPEPILFILAAPTSNAVAGAVMYRIASRMTGLPLRRILFDSVNPKWPNRIHLSNTAVPMMIVMVGLALLLHSDRFILSYMANQVGVAAYSAAAQFYVPLWNAAATTLVAFWPVFSGMRVPGASSAATELKRIETKISVFALLVGTTFVFLAGPAGLLLSHGQIVIPLELAAAFGSLLAAQIAFYPIGVYLTEPKELKFQAICVVVMLVVGIPLGVASVGSLGVSGPVWASAFCILAFQLAPAAVYLTKMKQTTSTTLEIS